MKSERRHELQTNTLADTLGHWLTDLRQYAPAAAATVGAAVVLAVVYFIISSRSASAERAAWRDYIQATAARFGAADRLGMVADQYDDYLGGQWARLTLADNKLQMGVDQLFHDRTAAKTSLESAIEEYSKLRAATHVSEMQARAILGMGRAYESLAKPDEAAKQYDEVVKNFPNTEFADEARTRRADLDKPASKEFYAWFWSMRITPPNSQPGTPGFRPPFEMQSLPGDAPAGGTTPAVTPPATSNDPAANKPAETTPPAAPK